VGARANPVVGTEMVLELNSRSEFEYGTLERSPSNAPPGINSLNRELTKHQFYCTLLCLGRFTSDYASTVFKNSLSVACSQVVRPTLMSDQEGRPECAPA
jgi:hypothetical protein